MVFSCTFSHREEKRERVEGGRWWRRERKGERSVRVWH
jgi:hypothetical protein